MAKAIMIQGTMSNAGKSLVTAALCRIFHQDGKRVNPFKSQNMALNSFITAEGAEMGRAQVVQAEAAGVKPSVLMNPILLKPTSDSGSQVIVNGVAIGTMPAVEYYKYKTKLIPDIMKAYNTLAEQSDIMVIEGAGSPAEINLKAQDIVNMGMAKMAKSPVLLVADIDRGGVFASIYGTLMLLEPEERAMVKGVIINKFRGDVSILKPGLDMLEEKTGIPVIGVLPMMNVDIEDEDSLSERLTQVKSKNALIDIAVIKFPRMSNFTDFNVFELIDGVSLRYVKSTEELGNPDMIILPGTKNTIDDLKWMRQNGLETAVLHKANNGTVVFGICGGYQMLGRSLSDPFGYDSGHAGSVTTGMALLNTETEFVEKKRTIQMKGHFNRVEGIFSGLSGREFYGYEIHSGITRLEETKALNTVEPINEKAEPFAEGSQTVRSGMQVYGTYIHGIFDGEGIAAKIVEALLARKGLSMDDVKVIDYQEYKQHQYDLLAQSVREHLDMEKVYAIVEKGLDE
ncbi:cobyric acid synthase [Succiniclasticum ruminis]|uniref:Cobyric acid synthase n=1 Tax=Succiniclasticum ruminis DSM 9236 TaxID=1123323 RepID=A0A1I2CCE6_9FIRM|nr:cobyric acid synthase [Succiniclasticum ruminis]SFE65924.1 adenosylcobyric acid synthase (glutamine-hydrolysing) [Succiniclasticum ruminis DSM 9236]